MCGIYGIYTLCDKLINPHYDTYLFQIAEAAHTYFHSLSHKQSLEDSGKQLEKCAQQRRKNRKKRVSGCVGIIVKDSACS